MLREVLLDDRAGPACLTALLGVAVEAVWEPEREVSAGGAKRTRADLAAWMRIGGEIRRLAVETKVHSKSDEVQVIRTTNDTAALGLILAPGRIGLRWRSEDIARISRDARVPWACATTGDWHRALIVALEGCHEVPPWIADYQRVLARKASELETAVAKAEQSGVNHAECHDLVDASAWLWAMRGHIDDPKLRDDWSGSPELSGEVLYSNRSGSWQHAGSGADLYLSFEIKANHLVFQLRAGGGAPREVFEHLRAQPELRAAVERAGLVPVNRRVGPGKTCVLARRELLTASASDGAAVVAALVAALDRDGVGRRALEEAGRSS